MKRILLQTACVILSLLTLFSLAACGSGSSKSSESETTAAPQTTEPGTTAAPELVKETDLSKLHQPADSKDLFAGFWKITEGTGSQLSSFVYSFDGNGKAFMLIGTMGYFGTYTLEQKDGKDVFTCLMMFGKDYLTYKFSKDKNTVTLTSTTDSSTTTMERTEAYNSVPDAPESPVIDNELLGAWKDETGAYLYFDKSGIMYTNQLGVNFSFYTYSAENGKITQTFTMKEETTETATYKIENSVLNYNGYDYVKCSADELS